MSYTYDTKGNILSVSDGTHTITYEYDALNELTWEKNGVEGKAWKYSYDLGGNILSKTEYSYQNGTVGSTPLSTVTYTYGDANWPDLLTSYNGSSITYDAIGNPLSYRGWNFTWQGGRQLAAASDGTTSLSFVYNESGLRTEKTVGSDSHRYVYRGSTLVAEITGDYALYFHHDARSEIVGFTYASGNTQTEYFYRKNLQGDVIGIVDSAGASVAAYRYDAWGQILDASGTMASVNPIRYRGYYYDSESGLYYLQSRYYDPEICRFINADGLASTGQGILGCNMFAYCNNNPISSADADGTNPYGTLNIVDYWFIHTCIQVMIRSETLWEMEVVVYDSNGVRGRLDLYDSLNKEFYEIKSIGAASNYNTVQQMQRYCDTVAFGDGRNCSKIAPGTRKIEGSFQYGKYNVVFYTSDSVSGLIIYEVESPEKKESFETIVQSETEPSLVFIPPVIPMPGSRGEPAGGYTGACGGYPLFGRNIAMRVM